MEGCQNATSAPAPCMKGMEECATVTTPTASYPPCTAECLNGGTCTVTEDSGASCNCVFGFTGSMCETELPSCTEILCLNGGICSRLENQDSPVCTCPSQFTGSKCETVVCPAEADVPVYPGSTVTFSWPATEAGNSRTQPCPHLCQEVISTPPGAVVERVCQTDSGQWLETNITGCGLSITALKLCEATQVHSVHYICEPFY